MSYGSGRRSAFFKYQSLYTGRSDSTTVEHWTDFLCGWNNSACLSDPVMEKTCNGSSDILCACILKRWDLDGSDGKYPNDRSDFCTVCVWNLSGNQHCDPPSGCHGTCEKRILSGSFEILRTGTADTGIRRHRKSACRSGERYSGFYCVMGTYGNAFAGRFDRKTCMSAGKA